MKTPFELGVYAGAAAIAGWMAARDEYLAAAMLGLVSLGALYDFQRGYRRHLNAARKWREQRWNAWKALEKQYRDEVLAHRPPTVAEFNALTLAAERRAAAETTERFGPIS
jgi:hypothetical protein